MNAKTPYPNDLQVRLENAILSADIPEMRRAIEDGADVEKEPVSKSFLDSIHPDNDSPLTIIARVFFSSFDTNRKTRFVEEAASLVGERDIFARANANPHLSPMDVRWEEVKCQIFYRKEGTAWNRLPLVYSPERLAELTKSEQLFENAQNFTSDADRNFIDHLVLDYDLFRKFTVGVDFDTDQSPRLEMQKSLNNCLDFVNVSSCRGDIESALGRLLKKSNDHNFFAFGVIANHIGQISPALGKYINSCRCVIQNDNFPVIAQALQRVDGLDNFNLLNIMLAAGVDPNKASSIHARTPLMLAAKKKLLPEFAALLDAGGDPTLKDNQNFTALSHLGKKSTDEDALRIRQLVMAHASRQAIRNVIGKTHSNKY